MIDILWCNLVPFLVVAVQDSTHSETGSQFPDNEKLQGCEIFNFEDTILIMSINLLLISFYKKFKQTLAIFTP